MKLYKSSEELVINGFLPVSKNFIHLKQKIKLGDNKVKPFLKKFLPQWSLNGEQLPFSFVVFNYIHNCFHYIDELSNDKILKCKINKPLRGYSVLLPCGDIAKVTLAEEVYVEKILINNKPKIDDLRI